MTRVVAVVVARVVLLMEAASRGSVDGLYVECQRKESKILARTIRENRVSINCNRKDSVWKFGG